ncbi:MAG: 16S rRNA (uracil(1498)-N(3))-methyltransferase [Methylovirgula sp.]
MARYDFAARRLYVEARLDAGAGVKLNSAQSHYLRNVLRLSDGTEILVFNGHDGEWRARLSSTPRSTTLIALTQTRRQERGADLHYLFAPLKHARLDYMIQKAVEMGAGLLQPVLTRHTQTARVNIARLRANAIEAAEQCGILAPPRVAEPLKLEFVLAAWPQERLLIFCDEDAECSDPLMALSAAKRGVPLAVLIGPEGGFDPAERTAILAIPSVIRVSLGPRILRADTAAVAILALVQTVLGDWRS